MPRRLVRFSRMCVLALAWAAAGPGPAAAATRPQGLDQEKLKSVVAAYLVNFANHVRWPAEAAPAGAPLTIAVLGPDPFGETLDRLLAGKTAAGHPLRAVRATRLEELADCQIVFMDQPTRDRSEAVANALAERAVLVIAFEAEGQRSRAAVDLVMMKDGTVRYKLAVSALKRAGLTPSAGLLQHSLQGQERPGASTGAPP